MSKKSKAKIERILPKGTKRREAEAAIIRLFLDLSPESNWRVTVEELRTRRSTAQNSFLWGVVYPTILEEGGEALRGWNASDLHEFFLGEMWGWERITGFGRTRMRPARRSSVMTKMEFTDYISFIEQRALDMGIVIPEPNAMGGDDDA